MINITIKIFTLFTILSATCFSCSKLHNTAQMENFNIILLSTKVGEKINLKQGRIEYYKRMDVADVDFILDSIEMSRIFTSVPWKILAEIPNYYNPTGKCRGGRDDQNVCELVIINGQMHKKIRLTDCDDFGNEATETDKILKCIKNIHRIVRAKSTVKPLIEINI